MLGRLPLAVALFLGASLASGQGTSSGLTRDQACNQNLCLSAIYDASSNVINYTMTADPGGRQIGWYGVGTGSRMAGSSMMVGWVDSTGKPVLSPRSGTGRVQPTYDAQIATVHPDESFSSSNGTVWSWSAPVISSSTFRPSARTPFIYAVNPDNNPGDAPSSNIRQHSDFGGLTLDLTKPYTPPPSGQSPATETPVTPSNNANSGSASTSSSSGSEAGPLSRSEKLVVVHLVFMLLAWLVLAPIAALIGRWGRTAATSWFPYHMYLQIAALIFTIVGFGVAVYINSQSGAGHFYDTHGKIGLTIFIIVFAQSVLGFTGHQTRRFSVVRIAHVVLGLAVLCLAFYNLGRGFENFQQRTSSASKYIVWGIGFGGFGALYLLGLIMLPKDLKEHKASQDGRQIPLSYYQSEKAPHSPHSPQ